MLRLKVQLNCRPPVTAPPEFLPHVAYFFTFDYRSLAPSFIFLFNWNAFCRCLIPFYFTQNVVNRPKRCYNVFIVRGVCAFSA